MSKPLSYSTLILAAIALSACGGGSSSDGPGSSSSSDSSSSSSSSSAPAGWALVWSDEFEGEAIDTDKWSFEVNCTGGGNNELQCYTPRTENAYQQDGQLHIVARQETYSGPARFDDDPAYNPDDQSVTRDYTSARLRSKNKGDFTYGRIEFSAKMPQGQGVWPALWMLPTDFVYGGWPLSGEIDVFEAVNSNAAGGNEVHGTLHYGLEWPGNKYSGDKTVPATNIWDEFHTYAVEWEEGAIHWFVNDNHFATQTSDGWFNYYWAGTSEGYKVGDGAAPFDQNFHLLMNVAVGGNWPGSPNDETVFPQEMLVDYVRVYQCSLDPATGKGCTSALNPDVVPLPGFGAPDQENFALYDMGAATLTLDTPEGEVTNTLVPGFYQAAGGNLIVDAAATDGDSTVWSAEFFGVANIFLTTDDMADAPGVDAGLNLSSFAQNGELWFEIFLASKDPDAQLAVKLDSGWPNVSYALIDPPVGEWAWISVPINSLQPNNIEAGQVNLDKVTNPFVLEVSGGAAALKLRHIALRCPSACGPDPVLAGQSAVIESPHTVFDDAIDVNWDFGLGIYETGGGHVSAAIVDAADAARGKVLDVQFGSSGANGLAFIQSTSTKDMSAFAGGDLVFDIQVLAYSDATGVTVKADCINPCSSGDIVLGMVGAAGWETVTVPVASLTGGGLDLSRVNTPFVILPAWDQQGGVHLQIDNVRYIAP